MDLENYKVTKGIGGKLISAQFQKREEPKKRNSKWRRHAQLRKKIYLTTEKEQNFPDWRFVLIDYRNGNEQIKAKAMTHLEAWKLNKLLEGSGFAWARCSK